MLHRQLWAKALGTCPQQLLQPDQQPGSPGHVVLDLPRVGGGEGRFNGSPGDHSLAACLPLGQGCLRPGGQEVFVRSKQPSTRSRKVTGETAHPDPLCTHGAQAAAPPLPTPGLEWGPFVVKCRG